MSSVAQHDLLEEGVLTGLPLPVIVRPPVPMSDDALIAFSRRNRPYRIEQNAKGELEIMSPVGGDGSEYEGLVIMELGKWTAEHGGHFFSSNAGFRLPDGSVLSPDASWISEARWASLSKEHQRKFPPLCPEFVVEIRSESDSRRVLEDKMILWAANGAQLAWMIDPYAATVGIYRTGAAVEMVMRPEWIEADTVVPGFRLNLSDFGQSSFAAYWQSVSVW